MLLQSKNRYYSVLIFGVLILGQSLESASPSWQQIWSQLYKKTSSTPSWARYAALGGLFFATFIAGPWLMQKVRAWHDEQRKKKIDAKIKLEERERERKREQSRPAREEQAQQQENLAILGNVDQNLVTLYKYLFSLDAKKHTEAVEVLVKNNILAGVRQYDHATQKYIVKTLEKYDPLTVTVGLLWHSNKENIQSLCVLARSQELVLICAKLSIKEYFTQKEIDQLKYLIQTGYSSSSQERATSKVIVNALVKNILRQGMHKIKPQNTYIAVKLWEITPEDTGRDDERFRIILEMQPIAAIQSQLIAIRDGILSTLEDVLRQSQQLGPAVVDPAVKKLCDDLLNKIDEIIKSRDTD